ncbi:MAG: flagellar hook-associated protein FlgK [Eubacteriales bacterium]|nr:flagellar hook-associated protein FlgK [Eubacteriales bacterium]
MRPTFLAFQTASRALAANQANIDVAGNNIANVNTEGYTRQRVDLTSISNSGYTQKYTTPGTSVGLGVDVSNINQIRDPFLDARYRTQNAETSMFDTLLSGLSDLENVFDEAETESLQGEISNFVYQLQVLSQTPTSQDIALVARTAAQKVTEIINVYAKQTQEVREQQIYDLRKVVVDTDFNAIVKNIANLNTQIREELTHGNTPNELYDKRNTLIDELSGIANIKVSVTPEKVSEDLTIENLNISIYDPMTNTNVGIVKNGLYNTLTASLDKSTNTMKIEINSSFGGYSGDITSSFSGGSIKGYLDLINGKGTYADPLSIPKENTFRGTLYYENAMNTFASNFAQVLNDLNAADGPAKPLFKASDGSGIITAANISISDAWMESPSYITTTTSVPASSEGDNITRMINALTKDMNFYKNSADNTSQVMFSGTANEYMTGLIGELSLDVELNENFSDTASFVLNNLFASRESMSGVSLDEEGINLMAFQKSYNAAARYFTALDEALDRIINNMGLVGR